MYPIQEVCIPYKRYVSHTRGMYPKEVTSLMGTERVKREEKADARNIINEESEI